MTSLELSGINTGTEFDEETIIRNKLDIEEKTLKSLYQRCLNLRHVSLNSSDQKTTTEEIDIAFAYFLASISRARIQRIASQAQIKSYQEKWQQRKDEIEDMNGTIAQSRTQLEMAQAQVKNKQVYNELASRINKLPPKSVQEQACQALQAEIEQLEVEGRGYERTWVEKGEYFSQVVESIGGIKQHVMEGDDDEGAINDTEMAEGAANV